MPENLVTVSMTAAYFWRVLGVCPLMAEIAVFGKIRLIGLTEPRPVFKHLPRHPWMHLETGFSGHGK